MLRQTALTLHRQKPTPANLTLRMLVRTRKIHIRQQPYRNHAPAISSPPPVNT